MHIPHWRNLTEFLALSGLRCGEALALTMKDVDFKAGSISVNKTYDFINEIVTDPKTPRSNRDVYMQPELERLCRLIRKDTMHRKIQCGFRSNLFMCDDSGDFLSYYAYNKYLRSISKKTLGRSITTHVMRHTHTSLMAEADVPLDVLSRRLGHENSNITKNVYLHITNKQKEKDQNLLRQVELL